MAFREAKPFLIIALLLTVLAAWFYPFSSILPFLAFCYILYFFRDPERTIPADPSMIVSAADGVVICVDEVEENIFTRKKMKRVGVFLSVFDVHVNRIPYEGHVEKILHQPGQFLDARHPKVDALNENQNWLLQTKNGPIVVRQIAGLIARRIVAWKTVGAFLLKGERFGMIRFGSRTDVYLPLECTIVVKKGERVEGGSSVIARWPQRAES